MLMTTGGVMNTGGAKIDLRDRYQQYTLPPQFCPPPGSSATVQVSSKTQNFSAAEATRDHTLQPPNVEELRQTLVNSARGVESTAVGRYIETELKTVRQQQQPSTEGLLKSGSRKRHPRDAFVTSSVAKGKKGGPTIISLQANSGTGGQHDQHQGPEDTSLAHPSSLRPRSPVPREPGAEDGGDPPYQVPIRPPRLGKGEESNSNFGTPRSRLKANKRNEKQQVLHRRDGGRPDDSVRFFDRSPGGATGATGKIRMALVSDKIAEDRKKAAERSSRREEHASSSRTSRTAPPVHPTDLISQLTAVDMDQVAHRLTYMGETGRHQPGPSQDGSLPSSRNTDRDDRRRLARLTSDDQDSQWNPRLPQPGVRTPGAASKQPTRISLMISQGRGDPFSSLMNSRSPKPSSSRSQYTTRK